MKHIIILSLLFHFNFMISQEETTSQIPKVELNYEDERLNEETYTYEKVNIIGASPQMRYEFKYNNRKMLVAFFFGNVTGGNNVIATYIDFADTWNHAYQKTIEDGKIHKELKFLNTDDTKYIYFEYSTYGGTADNGTHSFVLFDIINNEIYELTYSGTNNYDKDYIRIDNGEFYFEHLLEFPEILNLLEREAKESKYIVRN